ncbi:hypothetical protein F4679DRAFT_525055 [Xylaria curta]|nr:hypothetical protein F4679DRAFT_525055 [Xylaria curta]
MIPESQLIFFWTTCAFFTLLPLGNSTDLRRYAVVDSLGNTIGSTGARALDDIEYPDNDRVQHELIVLGSRRNQFSHSILLVLQIVWQRAVVHRVNCGEIEEAAWEREPHTWKLIPLG